MGRPSTLECLTARASEDREPNVVHGKAVRPQKAMKNEEGRVTNEGVAGGDDSSSRKAAANF